MVRIKNCVCSTMHFHNLVVLINNEFIHHGTPYLSTRKSLKELPFSSQYYQYTTSDGSIGSCITPTPMVRDLSINVPKINKDADLKHHAQYDTSFAVRVLCCWIGYQLTLPPSQPGIVLNQRWWPGCTAYLIILLSREHLAGTQSWTSRLLQKPGRFSKLNIRNIRSK